MKTPRSPLIAGGASACLPMTTSPVDRSMQQISEEGVDHRRECCPCGTLLEHGDEESGRGQSKPQEDDDDDSVSAKETELQLQCNFVALRLKKEISFSMILHQWPDGHPFETVWARLPF